MAKAKKIIAIQPLTGSRMNAKQYKQFKRRLYSEDPGLEVVHPHAAGIDIGNASHFVAVPPGRDAVPVREFGSWTQDLHRMAEWLKACGITTVAMQSTGVYWFAVYDVLEQNGIEVFLVNARHTKNLPGRKSDVQECQWLMKLHGFGLLRNSFRPPEQIRRLRTIWRLRDRHVKESSRCIQHMQKALTTMNVQLANAISDLTGQTGQLIVRSILAGERDPHRLAEHRDPRIKATQEEIARSLEGNWQEDALFELQQAMDAYDFCRKQMAGCDEQLQKYLRALPTRILPQASAAPELSTVPPTRVAAQANVKSGSCEETAAKKPKSNRGEKGKRGGRNKNEPAFDLASELVRVYGVDVTRVKSLDVMTVQTVLSELGTDFRAWPTENHFASWLILSPRRDVSGGKLIRHAVDRAKNRVADALRIAATTLLNSDSYLGARYRSLRTNLGAQKAVKAMARHLACLIYRLVTRGEAYVERGQQAFEQKRTEREMLALQRKAARMGMTLVPQSAN